MTNSNKTTETINTNTLSTTVSAEAIFAEHQALCAQEYDELAIAGSYEADEEFDLSDDPEPPAEIANMIDRYAAEHADDLEQMRLEQQERTDNYVALLTDRVIARAKAAAKLASLESHNTGIAEAIFVQLDAALPKPDKVIADIITVIVDERNPLGKCLTLLPDGTIDKEAAVTVSYGIACQYHVPDHAALATLFEIVGQSPNAAISNTAWMHAEIGERFVVLSRNILESNGHDGEAVITSRGMKAFARLKVHALPSSWLLLDRDIDKHTPPWAKNLNPEEWLKEVDRILPGVLGTRRLKVPSSSSRVAFEDGKPIGSGNGHTWIKVRDPHDIERMRSIVMLRAMEQGLSWKKPKHSKETGEIVGHMDVTIVDHSVFLPGRLVFNGRPTISTGLSFAPWLLEHVDGQETIDTSLADMTLLQAVRIASPRKITVKMKSEPTKTLSGSAKPRLVARLTMANLSMDTPLELADGSFKRVKDLLNHKGKLRCQAPFRDSSSLAAFFVVRSGRPMVFDSGTNVVHVLPKAEPERDPKFDRFVAAVERGLENVLGSSSDAALVLNRKQLRALWDSTIYAPTTSKMMFLNRDSEMTELSVPDAVTFGFTSEFPGLLLRDLMDQLISEQYESEANAGTLPLIGRDKNAQPISAGQYRSSKYSNALATLVEILEQCLKLYKQVKSLNLTVDIFSTRGRMIVVDGVAHVSLPHRPFTPPIRIERELVDRVVADYSKHFPEFHDFLNMVLQSRFASDRRHAFIWLHASSSWGKGFLLAVFQQLGLVFEVSTKEIDKALEGGPVGVSVQDTLRAWILFVDEFKSATRELKQLNSQLTLAPKNQLRSTVKLYTKLFASAEEVRSLVGDGVEKQFNNRFAYLHPDNHAQELENRALFIELGKMTYLNALATYVADRFNAAVAETRILGAVEASKKTDAFLAAYQHQHRLAETFGELDDTLDDIVDGLRRCLWIYALWIESGGDFRDTPHIVEGLGRGLIETLKRTSVTGYINKGDGSRGRAFGLVLGDAEKFVQAYLNLAGDRSTIGKVAYKAHDIAERLHMRPGDISNRVRVYTSDDETIASEVANKRGAVVFEPPKVSAEALVNDD
jgi:hypothetical protein